MNTYNTSQSPTRVKDRSRRGFLKLFTGVVAASVFGGGVVGGALTYWSGSQNAAPHPLVNATSLLPLTVTTSGGMRIHHLQTGYVAVTRAHRSYEDVMALVLRPLSPTEAGPNGYLSLPG